MNSENTDLHPPDNDQTVWQTNDLKDWPPITWADIYNYLIESKTYDYKQMKAYRSLDGYNYVINGWIGDISSCVIDDVHFLKAQVSPSQLGKFMEPYSAWIAAKGDGVVLTGLCTCPARLGRSCSHIAGILFAAFLVWQKGEVGESCTDLPITWGKGSKRTVSANRVKDIDFKKPKCVLPSTSSSCNEKSSNRKFERFDSQEDFKDYIQNSIFQNLSTIPGTLLNKTLNCHLDNAAIAVLRSKSNLEEHGCHDYDFNSPISVGLITCRPCQKFYSKFIALCPKKQDDLALRTVKQNSALWLDARKVRITASRANSVPKTARGNPEKFIKTSLYPTFKGNKHTRHGQDNEENARQSFAGLTNQNVNKHGIVLCKEDPWLAASPDGIVSNCLLEIKCPMTNIKELIESNCYDVRNDKGQFYLHEKGTNGYFMQVQIGLHCLNMKNCFFFLWSDDTKKWFIVERDDSYLSKAIPHLRRFYFKHMLPILVEHYSLMKLKLSKTYVDFVNE